MTNMTLGKYVPYNSFIHRLDPRVKIFSMILFMVMIFLKFDSIAMNFTIYGILFLFVYLIMTGYNFDDIVQFMISPASEFIDSMANPNMFQDSDLKNSPHKAINLAKGLVKSYSFLHGSITEYQIDESTGDNVPKSRKKISYVLDELLSSEFIDEV